MGTVGRVAFWILALVGGYVVIRRYGSPIYKAVKEKALSAKNSFKQLGEGKISLVACSTDGNPAGGDRKPKDGLQSSPFYRWCYLVRPGDDAGSISEKITGDSSRYAEILVANPDIPKKGKMGEVIGDNAWDFATGSLTDGTKVFIPQTMNAWIDQFGTAKGGYFPYPPDPRMIVEAEVEVVEDDDVPAKVITTASAGFDFEGAPAA